MEFPYDPFEDRRQPENRLKRIAKESEAQQAGRVQMWLDLAKRFFDTDDDPSPSPA